MMKFDVQSLVDRESAERGREFGEWAAACGRNRERMQEIGETAAGAAYQISVGGFGRAEKRAIRQRNPPPLLQICGISAVLYRR